MRFGKTYTAYKLAEKMKWTKVLILTFKPAVENSWKEVIVMEACSFLAYLIIPLCLFSNLLLAPSIWNDTNGHDFLTLAMKRMPNPIVFWNIFELLL